MSSSSTTSNLSLGVLLLGLILATAQTPSQSTSATQTSQTDTSEKEKSAPKPTDMSIEDYAAEQIQPKDAQDAERLIKEEEETEKFTEAVNGGDAVLDGPKPALIIVMGPASCGKSTVGMSLGNALSLPFIDGDSLHPKSNVEKMTAGHPLDDSDRLPWLALIRSTAERVCREEWVKEGRDEYGVDGGDIASMAEWEFGEGWKWMHAGEGEKAGNGMVKRGLGRPAVIIACSALKKWYRDILRGTVRVELPETKEEDSDETKFTPQPSRMDTYFVYCNGTRELLQDRISKRKNHFMGAKMLDSQLATLENPVGEPGVASVDISGSPEQVTREAVEGIIALARA